MTDPQVIEKFTRCPQCRSFSVSHREPEFPETLKALVVPIHAFQCNNCSFRFTEQGQFSLKYNKNWLLIAIPVFIVAVGVSLFFLLSGEPADNTDKKTHETTANREKPPDAHETRLPPTPAETGEKPLVSDASGEQPETTTGKETGSTAAPTDLPPSGNDVKTLPADQPPASPTISGEIVLGVSNRFGANWRNVQKGLQISRISNGPLKSAGIDIGDIIMEIDGVPVSQRDNLLDIRNEVFSGKRKAVILKVLHRNQAIYYRMVKNPTPPGKMNEPAVPETNEATPNTRNSQDSPVETNAGKEKKNAVATPAVEKSVRLFSSNSIKIRKSMPDDENASKKYTFERKNITVRRSLEQRVLIAGDPAGRKKWAVDNEIIINRRTFPGLSITGYATDSGFIPENAGQPPLDITDLVPPDRAIPLQVELVDFGKYFANSEVYIVVR